MSIATLKAVVVTLRNSLEGEKRREFQLDIAAALDYNRARVRYAEWLAEIGVRQNEEAS